MHGVFTRRTCECASCKQCMVMHLYFSIVFDDWARYEGDSESPCNHTEPKQWLKLSGAQAQRPTEEKKPNIRLQRNILARKRDFFASLLTCRFCERGAICCMWALEVNAWNVETITTSHWFSTLSVRFKLYYFEFCCFFFPPISEKKKDCRKF